LWLLGIPLAFSLGVLASLLTFIPNIGPVLAALPALLLAFVDSPTRALYVALLYLGVQAVESYGITPFIERETVSLPPAVTLATQLALGLLAGFAGVIVAAPLAAVGVVLVQTFYIQDVLGDGRQESIGENP
jgi:predicted PurR-regulated permease PerM